jgi:hypothetical protein
VGHMTAARQKQASIHWYIYGHFVRSGGLWHQGGAGTGPGHAPPRPHARLMAVRPGSGTGGAAITSAEVPAH